MIFLANRTSLDKRTLHTRIHSRLQTQVPAENSPIHQVWYHTSKATKEEVRARVDPVGFLGTEYPVSDAELHVSFDFPTHHSYDFYEIQWVERDRRLMIGWHQDETHMDLGECHFQIAHCGETVDRQAAEFLDSHPLNVFDTRIEHLNEVLRDLTWENGRPTVPTDAVH